MSIAFPNLNWWLWSGKKKDATLQRASSSELNVMELDVLKFPAATEGNVASKSRRLRRKCHSQGVPKIDRDHDLVLVPSDGGPSSDSESDDSDWSIGWSEPHASGFLSDDEIDGGFGVLVRCYGRRSGRKQPSTNKVSANNANVPELFSADSTRYMEQWLSSLQGS